MAFIPGENPIRSVNGVTTLPAPSKYLWYLEDVSQDGAGRTENVVMDKKRIGQVPAVELGWSGLTVAQASTVLKAFNPEYVTVAYLDLQEGDVKTAVFYVGNRTGALFNSALNTVDSIGFKIIARNG